MCIDSKAATSEWSVFRAKNLVEMRQWSLSSGMCTVLPTWHEVGLLAQSKGSVSLKFKAMLTLWFVSFKANLKIVQSQYLLCHRKMFLLRFSNSLISSKV